jgi:drug/metabolite transporter (DMT)-like permease
MSQQDLITQSAKPNLTHWSIWVLIVFMGGASFSGIKFSVQTADPTVVACVRICLAAALLLIYMYATGRTLPAFFDTKSDKRQIDKRWLYMMFCGVIGYTIPFTLFPIALQTVDSLLGGIYMAFMPLGTIVMAHFFADEKVTGRKIFGFFLGTVGVILLIGPAALAGIGNSNVVAQLLLLLAVNCYSVYAVLTRRAPPMQARSFAAGTMLCAALSSIPMALFSGQDWSAISGISWASIIFLGLFPTGLAGILLIIIIRSVGAGFMATANYVTPIIAILLGMWLFNEPLKPTFLTGLLAILAGLAISQTGHRLHRPSAGAD